MIRKIKLMAEWGCWPLWGPPESPGDIAPDELPLSEGLKARLISWADTYDATYDEKVPQDSGFKNMQAKEAFYAEGTLLFEALKRELPDYEITYRDRRS